MKKAQALIACLLVLCIFTAPLASSLSQEEQRDSVMLSGYYDDLKESTVTGLRHFVPLLNIAVVVTKWLDGMDDPADPSTGYADQLRAHEAELTYTVVEYCAQLLANSWDGYGDIWKYTNSYWMRQSEVAAAELYADDLAYTQTKIAEKSGLLREAGKMFDNIEHAADAALAFLQERMDKWSLNDTYSSLEMHVNYGTQHTTGSALDISLRNAVIVSSSNADKVYISLHEDGSTSGTSELWIWGGTATLTAADGTTYVLREGYNDLTTISGFEADTYELQTNRTYAGSIVPTQASDAAAVLAGAVIAHDSSYTLATYGNNMAYINGTGYSSFTVSVGGSATSEEADLMPLLQYQSALISSVQESLSKGHAAAQAAYQIYDAAKSANVLISPSSLIPDLANVTVSSEQLYVLTVLYMQQMHEYYERYGQNITASGYNLSPESVDLYVRGDVYDTNGTMLFENVILTPYIWLQDMTLKTGSVTSNQIGLLAIWDDDVADITSWTGTDGNTKASLIQMEKGYTLDIAQIIYKNATVSEITMKILEIHEWDPIIAPDPWTPQPEPDYVDITPLIFLILLMFAGYCIWAWRESEEIMFLVVAVVLAIIAIVATDWVADVVVRLL